MSKETRQNEILKLIQQLGGVEVDYLCKMFSVTNMTIRRDLDALEKSGKIIRSHGGAKLAKSKIKSSVLFTPPFNYRIDVNKEKKISIAKAALTLLENGQNIFIGSSTTTYFFSAKIDNSKKLTVITDTLNIAMQLIGLSNISLVFIGGEIRSNTFSTVGSIAEKMIQQFSVDSAFIGISAIDSEGHLYCASVIEAAIIDAIIASSKNTIILADSTKLNSTNLIKVGSLQMDFTLITDQEAPDKLVNAYRKTGATIITATNSSSAIG